MFSALKVEITTRILQIETFLNAIHGPADTGPTTAVVASPVGSTTARGLIFVELYGIWEYTLKTAVEAAIQELKKTGEPMRRFRLELLGLLLHTECDAVSKCVRENMWEKRMELFRQTGSSKVVSDDLPFPNDGSMYRESQLQTIWSLFGITSNIVPDDRLRGRIGQIVDNRNEIAHGDSTAANVGCRYSVDEIRKIIAAVQDLSLHVVSQLETHCASITNVAR